MNPKFALNSQTIYVYNLKSFFKFILWKIFEIDKSPIKIKNHSREVFSGKGLWSMLFVGNFLKIFSDGELKDFNEQLMIRHH